MKPPPMIVLDRDGVLNELWHEPDLGLVDSPARADQVRLTPFAIEAVRRINEAQLPCVVASNQPGVAKGKLSTDLLREVTGEVVTKLASGGATVDRIYYCLHHPDAVLTYLRADCPNRKPRPGLLLHAFQQFDVDPRECWFIGDTSTDIRAGQAAGCRTAWIGEIRCDRCPTRGGADPDLVASDLLTAIDMILNGVIHAALSRQC